MGCSRAPPATLACAFLLRSASAQQVPCAPSPARLPLQAQLPGEWISSAALPGAPVRKLGFLVGCLPRGTRGGRREIPLAMGPELAFTESLTVAEDFILHGGTVVRVGY